MGLRSPTAVIMKLDIPFVRQQFPVFDDAHRVAGHAFDAAAGSFPCRQSIDALTDFYANCKVQPGNPYPVSEIGQARMQASKRQWAAALNVAEHELGFGPSTTQNIYVLANAFREWLQPGDEVIVTNQDHESNTGAMRRAVVAAGAHIVEWQVEPDTGLLNTENLPALFNARTRLICVPHSSNITGTRNDIPLIVKLAKAHGAFSLVDGVSYVPHDIPDVGALGADIYLFSLYKVFSVHQGVMVIREGLLAQLPKQGHFFKETLDVAERMVPAGPDHAQVGAAGAVLDYIQALAAHHNMSSDIGQACRDVSGLWHAHENAIIKPLFDYLTTRQNIRLLGARTVDADRCPLLALDVKDVDPEVLAQQLCTANILCSAGHFYAPRILAAVGIEPDKGVLRLSMAHYNDAADISALIAALDQLT